MSSLLSVCRFNPTLGGTTDWTYSSAAAGYNSPSLAGIVNGAKYSYRAESADLSQWENGTGTYNTSTGVLTRTNVLYNSLGTGSAPGQNGAGTKIGFSAVPQVAIVAHAEDLVSPAILQSYLSGLTLSTVGGSAHFFVGPGVAADSTNSDFMVLASAFDKVTGSWGAGTGGNALDTGTIAANTWYHVFLIKRPDSGLVDVLISLSATAPTLPTNYTSFRRIGSMKTDSSSLWRAFVQDGDRFRWVTVANDVTAVNPGTSAVTRTLDSVPSGVRIAADVSVTFIANNGGGGTGFVYLSDLLQADQAASSTAATLAGYNDNSTTGHTYGAGSLASIMTNTSQQIRSRIGVSSADLTLYISTHGWTDTRGR